MYRAKGVVRLCGLALALVGMTRLGMAAEYQLRLANLEDRLFASYVDMQGQPFRAERHILPRLEAALSQDFPRQLLIDRHVRVISPQGASLPPSRAGVAIDMPDGDGAWTVAQWDGAPGADQVLRISSNDAHYQELVAVAVKRDGVLRLLPIYGVPLFGPQKLLAPAMPSTYIDYALERGAFDALMQKHAISSDGLSVLVGRHHDLRYPDQLYVRVRMPQSETQYTLILAWKDRDELRRDGEDDDRNR